MTVGKVCLLGAVTWSPSVFCGIWSEIFETHSVKLIKEQQKVLHTTADDNPNIFKTQNHDKEVFKIG